MTKAIGIDLGGTRIKGVLLDANGKVHLQEIRDTQDDGTVETLHWKEEVKEMIGAFHAQIGQEVAIGISAPGLPDADRKAIAYMPGRMQGLEHLNWAEYVQSHRLKVLNDANAALIAEQHFGVARGFKHVILLTLGTGIGGAMMIDGKLYTGLFNRGGHLGHISLNPDGETGIVNLPGTLEYFFGNASISKRSQGRFSSTAELVAAYERGETYASLLWLESLKKLALGISSLINVLAPELVLLSGGITQAETALFDPLRDLMEIFEWRPGGVITEIRKAHFGELAGAVGAAAYMLYQS